MAPLIPGDRVLVTGANSYVGSHICAQLISAGYHVIGTARSPEKIAYLSEYFTTQPNGANFSHHIVPNMAVEDAYSTAMTDCAGIVHVAADLSFSSDTKVIDDARAGVTNILRTATKHASIKRFVYTSASGATHMGGLNTPIHVTSSTWNDAAVHLASVMPSDSPAKGYVVYAASKTVAERAVFAFAAEHKPSFEVNSVVVYFVIGSILHAKQPARSAGTVRKFWAGDGQAVMMLRLLTDNGAAVVDVGDTAALHVAALTQRDVVGERLFAYGEKVSFNGIVESMEGVVSWEGEGEGGERQERKLPDRIESPGEDLCTVEMGRSREVLGRMNGGKGFKGLKESVVENFRGPWDPRSHNS